MSFGDATPSSPQAIILAWERGEQGERGCPDLSDEVRIKEERDMLVRGPILGSILSRADGFGSLFLFQEGITWKDG